MVQLHLWEIKKNLSEVTLWHMHAKHDYNLEKEEGKVEFVRFMIHLAYQKVRQLLRLLKAE